MAIMGDVASQDEIKDSDPNRVVLKMEMPEWICATLCAGLDIDGINDGTAIEDPEEV